MADRVPRKRNRAGHLAMPIPVAFVSRSKKLTQPDQPSSPADAASGGTRCSERRDELLCPTVAAVYGVDGKRWNGS